MPRRSLIVGIGNLLMGDDGIGVEIARELKKRKLRNVDVIEGGTLSFQILDSFLDSYDYIIIVDGVKFGKKPGRIYKLRLEDVIGRKENLVSVHDLDVFYVIKMVRTLYEVPEIVIVGVEIKNISESIGISPELRPSIKKVIKKIRRMLSRPRGRCMWLRKMPVR